MLQDISNDLKWEKLHNITFMIICSYVNISTYIAACLTTEGKQCLFPFKYMNKTDDSPDASLQEITYTKCSTETLYRPWCPTSMIVNFCCNEISLILRRISKIISSKISLFIELTNDLKVVEWGDCLPDCPTQDINPVCLMDPTPPAMEDGYQGSKNYTTDYVFGIGTVTKGVISQVWVR